MLKRIFFEGSELPSDIEICEALKDGEQPLYFSHHIFSGLFLFVNATSGFKEKQSEKVAGNPSQLSLFNPNLS